MECIFSPHTKKIRSFICEYELKSNELPGYVSVSQVSLLQSPAAGVHAVRWVGSSHRGTNDRPAGRSPKPGEDPTSVSRQE